MARPKGTAQVTSLSRGRSHPRAGLSRTWRASPSPSPNGHLPWLPGTRVLGRQSSVGSVVAHGQRQSGGACGAAEGLLPATTMFGLPALELLGDTLLVVSDTLRAVLGLLGLPWETPLWAALLVWVVQSGRPFRRGGEPAERGSGWAEVYRKAGGKNGRRARGLEALQSPAVEASAPTLQCLCLAALPPTPNTSSPNRQGFPGKGPKSQPSHLCCLGLMWARLQGQIQSLGATAEAYQAQGTQAQNALQTAQEKVHHLREKLMVGLQENAHLRQCLERLCRETEGWKQRTRVLRGQKDVLARLHTRSRRVLEEKGSQLPSLAESTLKTIHWPEPWEAEGPRVADHDHPPARRPQARRKRLMDPGHGEGSLQRHEEHIEAISRKQPEDHPLNGELAGQVQRLQAECASLQADNTQLEREIQELRLQLRMLPQLHEEHLKLLLRRSIEEEARGLAFQKKCPQVFRRLGSLCQQGRVYKKRAEDVGREVARTAVSYQNGILFHETRAHETGMAALWAERQLLQLRRENAAMRQRLAHLHFDLQPCPSRAVAPAVPHRAHRCPQVPGQPLAPQLPQEAGRSHREGSAFPSPTQVGCLGQTDSWVETPTATPRPTPVTSP